ncbi:hypothetical protein [Candidatus Lariskella endosymbiont of Epinotia ramella]|uniref:hypothetical protein n=1 Tax=Candidatus Lariskella endosymbiont of Epinotia ramella TaxID=3066224 RepID=UPI0030CF8430
MQLFYKKKQNHIISKIFSKLISTDFKSFLRKVFLQLNPAAKFYDNWHIDLIINYLLAIEAGKLNRLIINMPPRSLKSVSINVAWSAWLLGQNPACRIISISYSKALSQKHANDTRIIMNSEWYQNAFPSTKILDGCNTHSKFMTTQNGFRMACSTCGTLTGEGGDIIDLLHNHIN